MKERPPSATKKHEVSTIFESYSSLPTNNMAPGNFYRLIIRFQVHACTFLKFKIATHTHIIYVFLTEDVIVYN